MVTSTMRSRQAQEPTVVMKIRMPNTLHEKLIDCATQEGRTLSNEIRFRLARSLEGQGAKKTKP